MDVLREREAKDSLERQLVDERKLRGMFQVFIMFIYRLQYIFGLS